MHPAPFQRDRLSVAILALGGQGGGVLADWILEVANHNGFIAQGTSVPGVAQRTGSTIYYIEMVRRAGPGANQPEPVLALMPAPGDVDVVIASELMEAGRAMVRGLVSAERTTLVSSTHRAYAISEKSALGDGRASSARVLERAGQRAARFVGFDMEAAASRAGSVISSVMLGALAASGALPFSRAMFEDAIRKGGKATETNLKGFAAGVEGVHAERPGAEAGLQVPEPSTEAGRRLKARIVEHLPQAVHDLAILGAARLADYQDHAYAGLYLDRLEKLHAVDDGRDDWRLTTAGARHLALWMSYEDVIRVADLKVRAARRKRVEDEVRLKAGQVLTVTEYMHPRAREVCEMLPAPLARLILGSPLLKWALERAFSKGRHVRTTSLGWNLALRLLASFRGLRRSTLRYAEEQHRIEAWLALATEIAPADPELAAELIQGQELIKGYGDTFDRGLANFETILAAAREIRGRSGAAERLCALRTAALADEDGAALREALKVA